MKMTSGSREGCPWISFQNGEPIFGDKSTECPVTVDGCPAKHMGYTSDQLYQYPMCLKPEIERKNFLPSTYSTGLVTQQTTNKDISSHTWRPLGIFFICLFTVTVLLLAAIIVYVICRKRTRGRTDEENGVDEKNPFLQHGGTVKEYPMEDQADDHVHTFVETECYRELYSLLKKGNVVWLSGIYGSGKTRCAKAYARSTESILIKLHCLDKNTLNNEIKRQMKQIVEDHNERTDDDVSTFIDNLAKYQKASGKNMIILFCHVTNETSKQVENLAKSILENNGFKCIATSFDKDVFSHKEGPFDDTVVIRCNKGFTDEDSIQFFGDRIRGDEDKKAVIDFSKEFDGHPLTLATARSEILRLHDTPATFLENFKKTGNFKNSIVNNEFKLILRYLHNNTENVTIMKLLKSLQFLKSSKIPIHIFRYLFDEEEIPKSLNSFVDFIQRYSIGEVEGTGEERLLNVHKAVTILLRTNTDKNEQSALLMKMLMTLNCLFSTNQSCCSDHGRCIGLLEHATETIAVAQDLMIPQKHCLEKSFAIILLCEKVSHTYKLTGDLEMHAKYIRTALDICYEAILQENHIKPGKYLGEKVCKEKAADILDKVQATLNKSNDLSQTVKIYSLKKFRSKSLLKELHQKLETEADDKKVNLTEEEYLELVEIGYAVDRDKLARNSLTELVINIFLSYGLLSMSKRCGDLDKSVCTAHVHIAFHLAKCLTNLLPSHQPLCRSRAEISGRMEIFLTECESAVYEEGQKLSGTNMKEIRRFCTKLFKWMETERRFFMYGIYVLNNSSPEFEVICQRQILRCSALLYSQSQDENKRRLQEQEDTVNRILSSSSYQSAESLPILRQALDYHHKHMKKFQNSAGKIQGR